MEKPERKCITLKQDNINYIENLIGKEKYKNFSQAVDDILSNDRINSCLDACFSKEKINENVSFKKVAELVNKSFKKQREV